MGQFIAPKATTTQRLTIIPDQGELLFDTTVNKLYGGDGTTTGGFLIGNGDVSGPSSAVNNRVVFFDGPTGKLIKDSGLTLSGTNTGDQTITLTGDVTGSGTGSFAASISAGSVTLAKMANLSANSIIGNNTGSAATPIALSGTNVTAMLDAFSSTLKGLAPASGGGTTNFLRADGTWAAPPNSGGTVTSITASSPLTGGTITSSGTIGIQQASDFQSGSISASDYRQIAKISSSLSGMDLNSAGANARIGTSNLSNQKNLTITVYDEDAIKITTDVSSGPTFIDIAPGYTPGITTTSLSYNGEAFLNLTGTSTGSSPTFTLYGSDGVSNSQISLTQDLYLSGDNATISVINDFNIQSQSIKYTNGTNYVGFQLPTLTADSLYTLPVAKPTSNKVLQSDSTGVMTWITPSSGTVTSVAALTLGTSGTDLSSTVANGTTTPVITLNVPDASSIARGALTSTDWSTFNNKQNAITTGTTSQYFRGDLSLATFPILGTWSTLDYPTWTTGTPFVKMTAAGTFSLDTATYLTTNTLLTGLSGGQTVIGGTAASNNLTLSSTSDATKGKILFGTSAYDEANNRLGIGTASPGASLSVVSPSGTQQFASITGTNTASAAVATPCITLSATLSPTTNSGASYRTLTMSSTYNAPGINFTGAFGNSAGTLYVENRITSTGTITSLTGAYFVGMLCASQSIALGTVTTVAGTYTRAINSFSNFLTSTVSSAYGSYIATSVKLTLTITAEAGQAIEEITTGTNNTNLLLGTGTIPTGNWSIYNSSTRANYINGNLLIGTTTSAGYKLDVNGTARFQNDVTISDTRNFIFSATIGTKIGTATGQKLAFWNKAPIAQPTTASLSSTFTANTGTAVNDASTFGGYTLKQIAQALIDIGILA